MRNSNYIKKINKRYDEKKLKNLKTQKKERKFLALLNSATLPVRLGFEYIIFFFSFPVPIETISKGTLKNRKKHSRGGPSPPIRVLPESCITQILFDYKY